jgi:hypothetical protein
MQGLQYIYFVDLFYSACLSLPDWGKNVHLVCKISKFRKLDLSKLYVLDTQYKYRVVKVSSPSQGLHIHICRFVLFRMSFHARNRVKMCIWSVK